MICKRCKNGESCGCCCIVCEECQCICAIDPKVYGRMVTMKGHFLINDKIYCVDCYSTKYKR